MMRLPSPPMPFYTPCTTTLIDAPTVTRSRQYFAGGLFRGVSRCTGGHDCGTIETCAAHILLIRCRHWYYYVSTTASGHIMLLVRAGRLSMLSRLSGACSSVKNRHKKKKPLKIYKAESNPLGELSKPPGPRVPEGLEYSLSVAIASRLRPGLPPNVHLV